MADHGGWGLLRVVVLPPENLPMLPEISGKTISFRFMILGLHIIISGENISGKSFGPPHVKSPNPPTSQYVFFWSPIGESLFGFG